ncbi:MAG: hypothetical protein FWH21_05725 [Kiritimatiellaeota bacterium]|nr:hypothetical protein [Kiritimatiellota bacterium]
MEQDKTEVVITDINIPFWRMVMIIIKWALAAFVVSIIPFLLLILIQGCLFGAARARQMEIWNNLGGQPDIQRLR